MSDDVYEFSGGKCPLCSSMAGCYPEPLGKLHPNCGCSSKKKVRPCEEVGRTTREELGSITHIVQADNAEANCYYEVVQQEYTQYLVVEFRCYDAQGNPYSSFEPYVETGVREISHNHVCFEDGVALV
jgi:hypothetical protein